MGDERRGEPRVRATLAVRLAFGSVDEFIERHALDISRGGIFVRTLDPRPVGTEIQLAIDLAGGEKVIRGVGVVRWAATPSAPGEPPREPGMGVQFTELEGESRALLDRIVASLREASRSGEPPGPRPPAAGKPQPEAPPQAAAAPEPAAPLPGAPAAPSRDGGAAPRPGAARRTPSRPAPAIGIDLGTTNSCVAVARGGKATVLASREGHRTLPSVVAYDAQGRLLVGHPAKAQMMVNPRNTVYGSKRLVGRLYSSPTAQACRDRFHYEIVEGPGGAAAVRFAGRDFSPQQIAAFILGAMRETASQALGAEVERAVVAVPAYYDDRQRSAVREAGRLAGLAVERIVNEPTAAALAFGYGKGLDKRVMVYDLGGGTFDASVLEIQGEVYEVLSTGGDTFLGGVDFDGQVMDHLAYRFMERWGFVPPADLVVWQRIRDAAEELKVALSSRESAAAHVPHLCRAPDGSQVELRVELTRGELEGLTARLIDRSIAACQEVLAAKGLEPADLEEVLLVGGQSRMPLVRRRIREALGREPNKSVHPDEAVAIGAALLADSTARIDSVVLIDVLAMTIGVGLPGGRMAPVLMRNTRLPAKKSYRLATTRDGQTEVELAVFQGDSPRVSECEYLGTVRVANLPPRPRGQVELAIEFALGAEGVLHVTARNLATAQVTEVEFATADTPASLREKLGMPEAAPRARSPARVPVPAPAVEAAAVEKKGIFGRFFGRR